MAHRIATLHRAKRIPKLAKLLSAIHRQKVLTEEQVKQNRADLERMKQIVQSRVRRR